jgi:uncharacterized protein YdeI (YjbR/CyaY-like superfamily)
VTLVKPTFFKSAAAFRSWLARRCASADSIWLGFYRKGSGRKGLTYLEAVDEALCYGWIDGLVQKHDEVSYRQKFTPRRAKSRWSKINRAKALRLIREGRMMPPGLREIARAKADGRWAAAYDSPGNVALPSDFLRALRRNRDARAFFETLNRVNVYAVAYRLQAVKKQETRDRLVREFVAKFARGETFH